MYASPKSFLVNLKKGYTHNVLSGDSILPLKWPDKGKMHTGRVIPITSQVLNLKPRKLSLTNKNIQKRPLYTNVKRIGKPIIHQIKGKTQPLLNRQKTIVNLEGNNTVPTMTPLSLTGKNQLMKFTPATIAKSPYYRDNALLNIQSFGEQQGLNSSVVYDIHPSKRGGMWLATYDGISYYDGTSFTDFTTNEGLPNGNVRVVLEDTKGNVWFCPRQSGLCKYNGDTLTTFTEADGLMNNIVFNIVEDTEENIWWSSPQGVTKYDGKHITHYRLGEANYTKLFVDSKGQIWTTSNKEIIKIDGESITSFNLTKMISGSRVATIFEDKAGGMWFGLHRGGVLKYDGKSFSQYDQSQGLPGKAVYAITQDSKGTFWLGTNKGLVKYNQDRKELRVYTVKDGLIGDFIIKIMEDSQKNLWLGTYKAGLMKFKPSSFDHQNLQGESYEDIVRAFQEDAQGVLWAITRNSGLLKVSNDTVHTISLDNPQVDHIAHSLATDKQHRLWIGVKGGVIQYTPKECLFYPIIPNDRYLTGLSSDRENNVWMETSQGIIKFDGKQFIEYRLPLFADVIKILVDSKGTTWIGTEKGLYKLMDDQAILYTEKEGLSGSVIIDLLEDSQGNIWIGTYKNGLMLFDKHTFTYYTTKEGLSSDFIKSIVEDKRGNIWLGTEKGLNLMQTQLNPHQNGKPSYKIINYGYADGLRSVSFESRCVVLDKKNKLWWGTGKQVINLDLNNFHVSQGVPQVHLRQLDINGTFVNFRLLPDSLKSAITFGTIPKFENYPSNLTLDHNHKHIKLHFSTSSNEGPQKTKYSYRIKGLKKPWSQPSEQPFAEYQHLPFGTHTFQVKAIGDAQIWSKTTEYTFKVKPPFWKSKGFLLLYVIGGITLVVIYIKWRLSHLVKKQQLLEKKVEERTFNLNEAIQQLNQLNLDLKQSKTEVIQLKEKEQEVLTSQIKQRENELLLIIKTINERLYKAAVIKDELFLAIDKKCDKRIKSAAKDLSKFIESVSDFDVLTERIEEKYPGMLMKIKISYPELSANDVKHCLYIKLNLTLKEVAQLHNVSVSAVKTARNRLKKRMGVPEGISLKQFIRSEF
ncbi:hypothetical protein BKI52_30685 [marine bacterium AO1-C]|nr:hypothetical protein BKI52_30685 [marine bacterium AO1-C]